MSAISKRVNVIAIKRAVVAVAFGMALVAAAGLGMATRNQAAAMVLPDDHETPSQSFGSAPTSSAPSGPSGTSTMGAAPSNSMPSKPSHKKMSSTTKSVSKASTPTTATVASSPSTTVATTASASKQSETAQTKTPQTQLQTTQAPAPQIVAVASTAANLPKTGPEGAFSLFAGASLLGFVGHKLFARRTR